MVPARIGEDIVRKCSSCNFIGADTSENEICPTCKEKTIPQPAIELGHIFQLGTKYSKAQGAQFLDEDGKQHDMIMGCYGIGVSRVIAAIIELNNDDKGIQWPKGVAPFDVEIIALHSSKDGDEILELTKQYYSGLTDQGLEVLVDDRKESPGRKFNDADLIGIPLRIVIGQRNLANDNVEITLRKTNETFLIDKNSIKDKIKEILEDQLCQTTKS